MLKDEEGEFIPIHYDIPDEYLSFDHESNTFKKELALAAFAFVASAPEADTVTEAYQHFDFDDLYLSEDYGLEEEADTVMQSVIKRWKIPTSSISPSLVINTKNLGKIISI